MAILTGSQTSCTFTVKVHICLDEIRQSVMLPSTTPRAQNNTRSFSVSLLFAIWRNFDSHGHSSTSAGKKRVWRGEGSGEVRSLTSVPVIMFCSWHWYSCFLCRPFIIDLESTNGTQVNDQTIPTSRYFELKLSDGASSIISSSILVLTDQLSLRPTPRISVIKFGESTREYVLLSEDAA